MSRIVLELREGRIFAGHLTNKGDALRPGSTDVTDEAINLLLDKLRLDAEASGDALRAGYTFMWQRERRGVLYAIGAECLS